MKNILIILLLLPVVAFSQRIYAPTFATSTVIFETAKISQMDSKSNKYGPETYKTSFISILNAETEHPDFTIDIPDKFFIKEAVVHSIDHKSGSGNDLDYTTYILIKGDLLCGVTFYYQDLSEIPYKILISVTKNINKTGGKSFYLLSEFK